MNNLTRSKATNTRVGNTGCVVPTGIPSSNLCEPARHQLNRHVMFSLIAPACAVVAALLYLNKL